jgi:antitoxin (DNA-binding transcriptional repressor) of toxin-antitoxin stability system
MSLRVGMRELREKLADYLESSVPIEVTRHGQTIGFYIPVPNPTLTHEIIFSLISTACGGQNG